MANNYTVKVHIEIIECPDAVTAAPSVTGAGGCEVILSAKQAQSIAACEQLLLQTNYAALREAFAAHLSAMSRQYALQVGGTPLEWVVKPYRVDGEVGRITFDTYGVHPPETAPDDAAPALCPALHAHEWYRTTGFKELALRHGTVDESFRKTSDWLNRVRHQEAASPARTLRDNAVAEGEQISAYLEQRATAILQQHAFTPAATNRRQQPLVALPPAQITPAIQACAPEPEWVTELTAHPVPYEDPARSTQVSLDDVGVKRQKATRKAATTPTPEHKYVHNTIAHIAHAGAYLVNSLVGRRPSTNLARTPATNAGSPIRVFVDHSWMATPSIAGAAPHYFHASGGPGGHVDSSVNRLLLLATDYSPSQGPLDCGPQGAGTPIFVPGGGSRRMVAPTSSAVMGSPRCCGWCWRFSCTITSCNTISSSLSMGNGPSTPRF